MATGIEELIDVLFTMIDEAKNAPLSSEKCIIERDRALDILDDIKEIENKLETDHVTLEELRLAMENVATDDDIRVLTEDVAAFEQKLEDTIDTFATKEYVTQ